MNATRKILYISPVADRGGAETLLLEILRYQNREVYEPLVGFLRTGPFVKEVERLGVRTVLFPTTRFRDLLAAGRAIRSIRSFLRQERVGLVFGNMAMGHLYGGLAALGTETQAVWFQHGIPDGFLGVDLVAARVPSKVIFVYTEAARRAQARFGPAGHIVIMPGCVDIVRFDPATVGRGLIREELGIGAGDAVVACVARLQRWKGQSLFLRMAALVNASFPQTHFLVVGGALFGLEPDYARNLEQEARHLLPSAHVHFLGHRHDLPEILSDVDVLVHCPLTPEPFGLVILEAMAMRVPVVATRAGGPESIVAHGETGVLVAPGDPTALAVAVEELLQHEEKREVMGRAGRRRVEDLFSAERIVQRIEANLQRVSEDGIRG